MMSKKINYKEGDLFSLPLKSGGFGVGLIARATRRGPAILAYFFNLKYSNIPQFEDLLSLTPSDAIKVIRTSDIGLLNGEWEIIGELPNWDRLLWKFPQFVRREEFSGRIFRVTYSDDDPIKVLFEERITEEEAKNLERNYAFGYAVAEIELTKLLNL